MFILYCLIFNYKGILSGENYCQGSKWYLPAHVISADYDT